MKKVKVFEQCDPLESGSVYGVCDWCEDYDWWCEGGRPLDYDGTDCESGTIKEMNVGDVFYSKAEFGVDVVIANGNEIINDDNMSLFVNVDDYHSFNGILDENLKRLFTADEFVTIVWNYEDSYLNPKTGEYEYDEYTNSDEIFAQWCSNNRGTDEGNDECYYDGEVVWHTVYMKHTVCEDCVKTEYMWSKE